MAEETTEVAQENSTADTQAVSGGVDAPVEVAQTSDSDAPPEGVETTEEVVDAKPSGEDTSADSMAETPSVVETAPPPETTESTNAEVNAPQEPDDIQPFVDKAFETIQHEVEHKELDAFLRAHVKTFREEWDIWPDSAKDAYMHMMTSQLLQRKAANTRIMNYEEFKLPVPSAQTKLFESIKQSQVKPQKCVPVLLLPPNLRPTYALKK